MKPQKPNNVTNIGIVTKFEILTPKQASSKYIIRHKKPSSTPHPQQTNFKTD